MSEAGAPENRQSVSAEPGGAEPVSAEPVEQVAAKKPRPAGPGRVARAYFDAVAARDVDAMVACWAPGGMDHIGPVGDFEAPDGIRELFAGLFAALPDSRFEVLSVVTARNQAAVRWRMRGTFSGGPFQGIEPTGARIDLEGIDLLTVEGGLIRELHAYYDGTQFARQVGLLPPRDSGAERGMAAAFNARTRISRSLFKPRVRRVADDVLLVQGGFPRRVMNVYLIQESDGVTVFDAGIRAMVNGIASTAVGIGGIKRVVLGHAHPDHRGAAPGLAAPVWCHVDDAADAQADGGAHYFDFSRLEFWPARMLMPLLLKSWDGGPVRLEGTLSEGDQIAGFEVVHLPGHAPGLIGLWREADRLALVSDCFYTLDPQTGLSGAPRVPHPAFNQDTGAAVASIRKLAALDPAEAWPGHAEPLRGDVRAQLERIVGGG